MKEKRRPLNDPRTKGRLLVAARTAFRKQGYAKASVREIAKAAGVSAPLVLRYFSTKAKLFEAVLLEYSARDRLFLGVARKDFGKHLSQYILKFRMDALFTSTFALALGHPEARRIAMRVGRKHILPSLARWLGPPEASERAICIIMLATGFQIYGRQLPLMPNAVGRKSFATQWLAESIQTIVDQSSPPRIKKQRPKRVTL